MKNINKKSIIFALGILAILAFAVLTILPGMAAAAYGTNSSFSTGGNFYGGGINEETQNPKPVINSISPRSSNIGVGTKTVTITGSGFIPGSIVRINGTSRSSTFIDDSHILVQITGTDTSRYSTNGGFFIGVYNGAPGGGYSNAIFFTVHNAPASPSLTSGEDNYTSYTEGTNGNTAMNGPDNFVDTVPAQNSGDNFKQSLGTLASNAVFGSNSFLPSGIVQWIFVAIIILVIVILVRKIFGGEQTYHATPLKHD